MAKAQYFILMSSGQKFEISELDFNNIKGRQGRGSTNGWYTQRGEGMGTMHDWAIQFKDLASYWSTKAEETKKPKRSEDSVDITKRLLPEVGAKDKEPEPIPCTHNWNDPEQYEYVTTIVNGVNRYHKVCNHCQARSPLVKKREVELAMEEKGLSLNEVPLV